jgi:CxxC motif-containing protein (DUF1111 family)
VSLRRSLTACGEAQASRDAYGGLSKDERDALDAFVNSL